MADPIEYNLEILMKPDAAFADCPEVETCQLELFENSESDNPSLILEDTTEPLVKNLQIFMEKADSGCDYALNIGMVPDLDWIAVGDTYIDPIPPATYGQWEVWETAIGDCTVNTPLFTHKPLNLIQLRYDNAGEKVSIFHYGYTVWDSGGEPTSYLAVSVLRGGQLFTISALAENNLRLYGALSTDFNNLYISNSTESLGVRSIAFENLSWVGTEWVTISSGPVDTSGYEHSQDPVVDRDGNIHAAFSDDTTETHNTNDTDNAGCFYGDPQTAFWYHTHSGSTVSYDYGVFSIPTESMSSGEARSLGQALYDGELHPILSFEKNYDYRKIDTVGESYAIPTSGYNRYRNFTVSDDLRDTIIGDCTIDGSSIGELFNGSWNKWQARYNAQQRRDQSCPGEYAGTVSYDLDEHSYRDGYIVQTAMGGWVLQQEAYALLPQVGESNQPFDGCGIITFPTGCPSYTTYINIWLGDPWEDYAKNSSISPVEVIYENISNTFFSYDQETSVWYAGIYRNDVEGGDYYWTIYRNGIDVTSAIVSCVGDLDDTRFSTMYIGET